MWKAVWGYYLIASGAVVAALLRPAHAVQDQLQEFESDWTPLPKRETGATELDES